MYNKPILNLVMFANEDMFNGSFGPPVLSWFITPVN